MDAAPVIKRLEARLGEAITTICMLEQKLAELQDELAAYRAHNGAGKVGDADVMEPSTQDDARF